MDPRMERRTRSCRFDPPETFREDVVRYRDAVPSQESSREPRDGAVFHADMDPATLDAYLCWRRDLSDGKTVSPD